MQQVGSSRLFVDKRGAGNPTVVFLPGAGLTGLDYLQVHDRVSKFATSIVYDRAGTGWSDRVRLPRSLRAVTDELHTLLRVMDAGPRVLVGHSLGGLYARAYAARFPDQIRGIVLLDPAHEEYDANMPAALTQNRAQKLLFAALNVAIDIAFTTEATSSLFERLPAIRRYQEIYRQLFEQEMVDWPSNLRQCLVERHASLEWLAAGMREVRNVDQLYRDMRSAVPLPSVPLIVLCSTGSDGFREALSPGQSSELLQAEIKARLRLYAQVAATVPGGQVREVDCGHVSIPFRQVDAIIEAIKAAMA